VAEPARAAPPRGFEEQLDRAAAVLREARSVALACHVNPDADALGSMLGLAAFLRARGTETICSYGNDPLDPPRWAAALPGAETLVHHREVPPEPAVMATFDCASVDRLGPLAAKAMRARELIWIDHHVSNDGVGTIPLIDPTASSTAEIVYRLVRRIGGEVPPEAAACLYAGIVTDTGRFQYEATTPETLRVAAELREHPFDHARLVQSLYEDNGLAYLRLAGLALARLEHRPDADLVWTYLTQADLEEAGVRGPETDDLIDLVRTAREADVAAVIKQQRDGRFKVSMRSRGGHDLARVAAAFGGGGHRLAAGYTSRHGLAETVERLARALRGEPVEP
jgi:phosphoesterase RecJ-like protein